MLTSGDLKTEDSLLQYCQHQTPNHIFKTQIDSGPMGVAQDIWSLKCTWSTHHFFDKIVLSLIKYVQNATETIGTMNFYNKGVNSKPREA